MKRVKKIFLLVFSGLIVFAAGFFIALYIASDIMQTFNLENNAYKYRLYSENIEEYRNINSRKLFISTEWIFSGLKEKEITELKNWKNKNEDYLYFFSILKEEDKLYHFETPLHTWYDLAGRKGVVIVRKGIPIYGILRIIN